MLKFLVEAYGIDAQLDATQEECAELIKAISKYKRSNGVGYLTTKTKEECMESLIEEIAHVRGCLEALQYLLNISDKRINNEIEAADVKTLALKINNEISVDKS